MAVVIEVTGTEPMAEGAIGTVEVAVLVAVAVAVAAVVAPGKYGMDGVVVVMVI